MVYILYKILTVLAYPFLYYKLKDKESVFFRDSFVLYDKSTSKENLDRKKIWIHAVSVGEILTALNFSKFLRERGFDVFFTTKTAAAYSILSKEKNIDFFYVPFDVPKLIKKFLDIHNPDVVMFFESEIWPNTISEIYDRKIPIYLMNARLSPKTFNAWKKLKGSFSKILDKFNLIITQSAMDAKRYKFFVRNKVFFTGNLKYTVKVDSELEKRTDKILFIAASTHCGEEKIIIDAFKKLKSVFANNIQLIIAPRHINRVENEILPLIKRDFKIQLRTDSQDDQIKDSTEVYILNTIGELVNFYKKTHIAFVGGSLVENIGGHNIFEAAINSNVILHGPFMSNQFEMKLAFKNSAYEVKNAEEIFSIVKSLIFDRQQMIDVMENTFNQAQSLNNSIVKETIGLFEKDFSKIKNTEKFFNT